MPPPKLQLMSATCHHYVQAHCSLPLARNKHLMPCDYRPLSECAFCACGLFLSLCSKLSPALADSQSLELKSQCSLESWTEEYLLNYVWCIVQK
jgi:hypothetical protein